VLLIKDLVLSRLFEIHSVQRRHFISFLIISQDENFHENKGKPSFILQKNASYFACFVNASTVFRAIFSLFVL
jgi:hypothetical protein